MLPQARRAQQLMLIPLRIDEVSENINRCQGYLRDIWCPSPHVTPSEYHGNPLGLGDFVVRKVLVQPPTTRVEPQVLELFVRVRVPCDERPLEALEIVEPRGRWGQLHPV